MDKNKVIISKWIGRFGNRCHSYLYARTIAKRNKLKVYLPNWWEGDLIFINQDDVVSPEFNALDLQPNNLTPDVNQNSKLSFDKISEFNKKYNDSIEFIDPNNRASFDKTNIAFSSLVTDAPWFYPLTSKEEIRNEFFVFNDEVKRTDLYKELEDKQGTYDVAHIRRGDIVNPTIKDPGHCIVSMKSYIDAYVQYGFEDFSKIEIVTDDTFGWKYDKQYPYIQGKLIPWLPDFLKLYFARTIFRGNSAFSFWAALLSPTAKVYSPLLEQYLPGKEIDVKFVEGNEPHWMAVKGQHPCYEFNIPNKPQREVIKITKTIIPPIKSEKIIQSFSVKEPPVPTPTIIPTKGKILLAHWNGRFGNRIFSYLYGRHYAEKFNLDFVLPSAWEGDILFKNRTHKVLEDDDLRLRINQTHPEMDNLDFRTKSILEYGQRTGDVLEYIDPHNKDTYGKTNVFFDSLCCHADWLFSEYRKKDVVEKFFPFSDQVKNSDLWKRMEDKQGTYDIAHLRRDDIANVQYNENNQQGYSVVSLDSYNRAFAKFGIDPKAVEWTTDDWQSKWGIKPSAKPGAWTYPMGSHYQSDIFFDWFPDFLRLYFARTIFRANSSFSWSAAFLSPTATVYSPVLRSRKIYKGNNPQEIQVEFVNGNEPHWMNLENSGCPLINIK